MASRSDIYQQLAMGTSEGLPDVLKQIMGQAKGDVSSFEPMERRAMSQFQQQIAPQIAQRYAGSGISGSSGMQNSLSGAGANLAESLAGKRQEMMHKSMRDVLSLGNMLLKPDQQGMFGEEENEPAWWEKALGFGLPILGGVAGGFLGGPAGAAAGATLGGQLGAPFSGQKSPEADWTKMAGLSRNWN